MMQELINVQVKNDRQLVSARDLYRGLGLKKKFTDWVKQNFKDFEENVDFTTSPQSYLVKSGNGTVRKYDDYFLTIDMAKQLCLMSRTEKGKQYRKYLIEVERKWNDPQEVVKRGYAILQNENVQLKLENTQLLETKQKLQDKIDNDADDVVFAKAIRYSHHAISIKELAEILTQNGFKIGQNQLFELLRKAKYLSRQSGSWNLPMGDKVKAGYFRIVHKIASSTGRPYTKTLVTPKGQQHIINKALRGKFDDLYQEVVASTLDV